MDFLPFFKSLIDEDNCAVVICNLKHEIIYMNPAAKSHYSKWGGDELWGKSLLDCHNPQSVQMIEKVVDWFGKAPENNRVHTFFNEKQNKDVYMVALRAEDGTLIGYYEKHEFRTRDESELYEMK